MLLILLQKMSQEWINLYSVACIVVFVTVYYAYLKWNYDYWKKRNIPFAEPKIFFGNYTDIFLGRTTVGEVMEKLYKMSAGKPFAGFWRFRQPGLLVREPENIKDVLTKQFSAFQENGFSVDPQLDPLMSKNPFFQAGDDWKKSRSLLTPNFTSGKLKPLYSLMRGVGEELVDYLKKTEYGSDGLEAKDLCSKYTMEMVATCGLGIKANSFTDPNAEFKKMTRKLLEPDFWNNMKFLLGSYVPFLGSILKIRFVPSNVDKYYRQIISEVMSHRERTGVTRGDFLQHLINLKKKTQDDGQDYNDEYITGHSVTFLVEGFETSSAVLSFCFHDLACNPEYQDAIREEIAEEREAENGELTYEALLKMPLLDQVLQETLRMHAPLMAMEKICTEDTTLRASDMTTVHVPKGMLVVIPVRAIHNDPHFYEEPARYDPSRWAPSRKDLIPKYTFLPFGEGSRMCLGMRFAMLQMKIALVAVLENFDIKTTPKTVKEIKQNPHFFMTCAKDGLWVKFVPRNIKP